MEILFLGTSCMQPTKERNHQGVLISYNDENILIDCGENMQRQLKIAGFKPPKITKILISHWHGDHVLGLPGLLQTLSANEYQKTLKIYGPKGFKKQFSYMLKAFPMKDDLNYELIEIKKNGAFFKGVEFTLEAYMLEHGIPCLGYVFVEKDKRKINTDYIEKLGIPEGPILGELQNGKDIKWMNRKIKNKDATFLIKGKKIGLISDTIYTPNCLKIGKDADILISESAFTSQLKDKAEERMHLTSQDAAIIASKSNAKKLVLTHFSQRYKDTTEILEDAKNYFNDVICAYDFMRLNL